MVQLLDSTDWEILFEYDKDPFQSYNAISKSVGVHHSTVSDRISQMKSLNILREDGKFLDITRNLERTTSEVVGDYSPGKVGLERVHVLFNKINSISDYNKLSTFCDEHPYTHYFTKLFGSGVSIYAQFDIPEESVPILKKTFTELKEYVNYDSFELYRDKYEVRAIPNFKNLKNYSISNSNNLIESLWGSFLNERKDAKLEEIKQEKDFDNIDAELIRELTINGKMKITDMTDYFDKNKSTLSRRLSKIRSNFVSRGRLVFGRAADRVLGYNNSQIVTGTLEKGSDLNADLFMKFIKSENLFPFDSFLSVDGNKFLLFTKTSVGIAGDLMQFLYEKTNPYDLNQYQFYVSKSLRYPFYHGNYDEDEGYNTSEEYIRDFTLNIVSDQ